MSAKVRRAVATSLAALGLAVLTAGALRSALRVPLGTSISVARKFWAGNPTTRVLNSGLFRSDPSLGAAVVAADRAWPLTWDADLVFPLELASDPADEKSRAVAFVLAPRRVFVSRGRLEGRPFTLSPRRGPR